MLFWSQTRTAFKLRSISNNGYFLAFHYREAHRHSPSTSSYSSEGEIGHNVVTKREDGELDLYPGQKSISASETSLNGKVSSLKHNVQESSGIAGKEEPTDKNSIPAFESSAYYDYDSLHSSETESIGSHYSEASACSAPIPSLTQPLRHSTTTHSHQVSPPYNSQSQAVTSSKPSLASSSSDISAPRGGQPHTDAQAGATDAAEREKTEFPSDSVPPPLASASLGAVSSPELTTKIVKELAPNHQREEYASVLLAGADSITDANHLKDSQNSFHGEENDESDGLIGLSGDKTRLMTSEEGNGGRRNDFSAIHALRPMQVRHMPLWFLIAMIICISLIGFGSYAAYDAVAAVQDELMSDLQLSTTQFGLLYSIYALPNILLVIIGGTLVDKCGSHAVGLWTTISVAVGAIVVAIAPSMTFLSKYGRFLVMLLGRFVFGAGSESSYVVQNSMCVKWFFGDHLATAMALTAVGARLGSISSFVLAPHLAKKGNYTIALWAAAFACVISFVSVVVYILLRRYAKNNLLVDHFDSSSLEMTQSNRVSNSFDVSYSRANTPRVSLDVSHNNGDDILEDDEMNGVESQGVENGRTNFFSELKTILQHVRNFSALFWGCAALGIFTYGTVLGFRAIAGDAMSERYKIKNSQANLYMASIDITGLVASPFVGWFIDYTLKLGWFTLFGNAVGVFAFILLIPHFSPLPAVILLGLSSTIVGTAIYPAISYVTPPSLEGLAFGVSSSAISAGNLLLNLAIAQTLSKGWLYMIFFLFFLAIFSVAVTIWWIIRDHKSASPVLNMPKDWSAQLRWCRLHLPFLRL